MFTLSLKKLELKNSYVPLVIQEYGTYPALRSTTSHFWEYVPSLQSFSFMITVTFQADATRCLGQFGGLDKFSPVHGMEVNNLLLGSLCSQSSQMTGAHPHSSVNALLAHLSSLLHRFIPQRGEATELLRPSMLSAFHPTVLFARLLSLIHRSAPESDAPEKLQQTSVPSRLDPHVLIAHFSPNLDSILTTKLKSIPSHI
jgi:hypothetical protein